MGHQGHAIGNLPHIRVYAVVGVAPELGQAASHPMTRDLHVTFHFKWLIKQLSTFCHNLPLVLYNNPIKISAISSILANFIITRTYDDKKSIVIAMKKNQLGTCSSQVLLTTIGGSCLKTGCGVVGGVSKHLDAQILVGVYTLCAHVEYHDIVF